MNLVVNNVLISNAYALVDYYRQDFALSEEEYKSLRRDLVGLLRDYSDTMKVDNPTLSHFIEWARELTDDGSHVSIGIRRLIDVLEHGAREYGDGSISDLFT